MNSFISDNLLSVGKVVRPHGFGGILRVWSLSGPETSLLEADEVFLKSSSGDIKKFSVRFVKPHKKVVLMKLENISSFEQAEGYRDCEVLLDKTKLGKEPDVYYWYELEGLEAFLTTGESLGVVSDIIDTGSNDIYVVTNGKREILIPAIHDVIKQIDLDNKKIIISYMEGLFDLNEV